MIIIHELEAGSIHTPQIYQISKPEEQKALVDLKALPLKIIQLCQWMVGSLVEVLR